MSEITGVIGHHFLGEVLKGSAARLGERCGRTAIELLSARLKECIGEAEDDHHTYFWRAAIEEHEQDSYRDSHRNVLIDALRDASLGLARANPVESREIVREFLNSSYPTLQRVGIFVCGERYSDVGDVFWECFHPDWLTDLPYWHELFWFIKKAFPRFSVAEREKFLDAVANAKCDWGDSKRREELDEIHQRDLLYPAVGLGDGTVDSLFQELVKRHGPVREHADFHSYTTSGWVGDRSPIASDEFANKTDEELLHFMRTFVPDKHSVEGGTLNGLAASLSGAVRASEDGFSSRITLFQDVPRPFQHGLLRGLKERLADDKREIKWEPVLSLLHSIVNAEDFRKDLAAEPSQDWGPSVYWVISDISDLIKAGAADKNNSMSDGELELCIEILDAILIITPPSEANEPKDAVSHTINSTRGRPLESVINVALTLRRREVAKGETASRIWKRVELIFNRELESSVAGHNAEFAALGGLYCPNLHFMSADWVEANFDRLFSKTHEGAWRCAAQGFSYQRYLYDWLYEGLVRGGHLRKMVFTEDLDKAVSNKALQFLGLAYLKGMEQLAKAPGGLLHELVAGVRAEELSHLCWFFWTLRSKEENLESHGPRILEFWRHVSEAIRNTGSQNPPLQSALALLAVFITEVTSDTEELLIEVAPYADVGHHGYNLIEELARLAPTAPQVVARVFLAALDGFVPEYKKEDVIRCIEQLAASGCIDEAEQICNKYAERGSNLLKETYEHLRSGNRS